MKTNYFNIGDKVYILQENGEIDEDEVIKIGKKYIKLKTNPLRYYLRDDQVLPKRWKRYVFHLWQRMGRNFKAI